MEWILITAPRYWLWTEKRYRLAGLIAEGKTYKEAGDDIGLCEGTVKVYMHQVKEFREYVDKITLENEKASRAGITRLLYKVIEEKLPNVKDDKDGVLSYLKFLHELDTENEDKVTELEVTFK